jgi:hypothetical protein
LKYQIWSNTSRRPERFLSGYQVGDTMKMSWEGDLHGLVSTPELLEHLFEMFNRDERPNGQIAHSLSIGDVVVLDGVAFAVVAIGFAAVAPFTPVIDYGAN